MIMFLIISPLRLIVGRIHEDQGLFILAWTAAAFGAGKRHNHRAKALVFRGLGAEPSNKHPAIRAGLHCLPLCKCTTFALLAAMQMYYICPACYFLFIAAPSAY